MRTAHLGTIRMELVSGTDALDKDHVGSLGCSRGSLRRSGCIHLQMGHHRRDAHRKSISGRRSLAPVAKMMTPCSTFSPPAGCQNGLKVTDKPLNVATFCPGI